MQQEKMENNIFSEQMNATTICNNGNSNNIATGNMIGGNNPNPKQLSQTLKDMRIELPSTLTKIAKKVSDLEERLYQNKKEANDIYNDMKELEKLVERYVFQYEKKLIKENEPKPRTPSGFAAPTSVSDELCEFMGKEKGTLISRTDTSRFLYKYIKDNGLNDPIKKNIIVPDTKLALLLGEITGDIPLTHFTIQTYISKHFHNKGKPKTNVVSTENASASMFV